MAVNKLPQAFDVEPMKLGDLDAVMAIEGVTARVTRIEAPVVAAAAEPATPEPAAVEPATSEPA